MTLTDVQMRAILARLVATGGPYDPATTFVGVASAVATVVPVGATAMADVTDSTGAVATRAAITAWSAPHKLNDGRWAVDGPLCEFSPLDATQQQVVQFWYYNSAATAGVLKSWEEIEPPVTLADQYSSFNIVPRLCVDPQGNTDASVTFNG